MSQKKYPDLVLGAVSGGGFIVRRLGGPSEYWEELFACSTMGEVLEFIDRNLGVNRSQEAAE